MKSLLSILAFVVAAAVSTAAEPHVYRAARLWPGDGPPIVDAVLVVRDGKVVAAGKRGDVPIPVGAVMHDLGTATIIPGLVVAETTLAESGRDDLLALTPHHRAVDGFDWYADFSGPLSGGVTTVQISPGARRLMPGQGGVVKLGGDDPESRMLRDVESLRVILTDAGRSPPRIYEPPVGAVSVDRPLEPTRPQLAASLASAVAGLRATFAAGRAEKVPRDPFMRAIAGAGSAKLPIRVTATAPAEVQAALSLAREFEQRLILVEPAVSKLTEWKKNVDGVVLSAGVRAGAVGDAAATSVPAQTVRDLRAAGLRVALKPVVDADLKEMLFLAGLFTTRLDHADALRMLTADSAAILGVGDRVGSLSAGKDADFVVLTGEPFELHTRVRTVLINGEVAFESKPAGARQVIRAGRILTGTGDAVSGGAILIDDGVIRAVGRDVSVPADAELAAFPNAVIVPGFIDLGTNLGVAGPIANALPFSTKLADRLVAGDQAYRIVRQGGTTTVLLSGPAPAAVLAFKLGDSPRVVKEPVALRFSLRGNLTSAGESLRGTLRAGKTYADAWTKYDAELAAYTIKKKEFDAAVAKAAAEKKPDDQKKPEEKKPDPPKAPEKPQFSDAMEPYRTLFAGKIPALVEARREDAIRLAVTICRDEFGVRTALVGADDAHRVADLLREKSVAVVAGPDLVRTADREEVNIPMALSLRAVPFGFHSNAGAGARSLPLAVSYCVRKGLGADDAMRGLTASAAQILGLENIGSIVAGKEADLVVLSGMPFELSTRVLAVMIDGKWVYREGE